MTAQARFQGVVALITGVRFPAGEPHGIALAIRARTNHPRALVVFTAALEMKPYTEDLGVFVPTPISPSAVAKAVDHMLSSGLQPVREVEVMAGRTAGPGKSRREVEPVVRYDSGLSDWSTSSPLLATS